MPTNLAPQRRQVLDNSMLFLTGLRQFEQLVRPRNISLTDIIPPHFLHLFLHSSRVISYAFFVFQVFQRLLSRNSEFSAKALTEKTNKWYDFVGCIIMIYSSDLYF